MKRAASVLLAWTALGFLLSAGVHLATSVGVFWVLGDLMVPLHLGVFVAQLPVILLFNKMTKGHPRKDHWKIALRGCPLWMQRANRLLFTYCLLRMVVFLVLNINHPKPHGAINAQQLAFFSSGWLAFYAMQFSVFYSFLHLQNDVSPQV